MARRERGGGVATLWEFKTEMKGVPHNGNLCITSACCITSLTSSSMFPPPALLTLLMHSLSHSALGFQAVRVPTMDPEESP